MVVFTTVPIAGSHYRAAPPGGMAAAATIAYKLYCSARLDDTSLSHQFIYKASCASVYVRLLLEQGVIEIAACSHMAAHLANPLDTHPAYKRPFSDAHHAHKW